MSAKWVQHGPGSAVVVFVHGVLSSGETCWRNDNGTYWPALVASSSTLSGLSVYVTTYRTGLDSGTYSVNNAAGVLFEELKLDGVLTRRHIVFVCHSMGGLVVRRMLVHERSRFEDRQIGLFLVASPSLGSTYANWLAPIARFFKHAQADALRMDESNQWLSTLDDDFFNLLDELDIVGRELVEDRSVLRLGMLTLQPIVSPLSASRFFRDPLRIANSDHFSIAKPADDNELQHRVLMEFVRSRLTAPSRHSAAVRAVENAAQSLDVQESTPPEETKLVESLQALLARASLVDYVLAANEDELAALVATVPRGRGIQMAFVPAKFKQLYIEAVAADNLGNRVGAASALVRSCFPEFEGRWHLVSIVDGEIPLTNVAPATTVYAAFQLAGLKGPRMLAAMIVEAPFPTLIGARKEAETMLRKLLKGEAS